MAARIAGFGGRPAIVAARPMANIASQVKRNERTEREHKDLVSRIAKAVQKGALHANNGARKKARAARLVSGAAA